MVLVPGLGFAAKPAQPALASNQLMIAASDCLDGRRFASVGPNTLTPDTHDPMELVTTLAAILPKTASSAG